MSSNHIKNIAIVGAGGQSGSYIAEQLVATGKFNITALTRAESTSQLPSGLKRVDVNYDDESTLVSALKGQDAVIVTMAVTAPQDQATKVTKAAAAAGVPWILPNEWGYDHESIPKAGEDTFLGPPRLKEHQLIKDLGVSSYIAVACGFWYEYSLSVDASTYGFDLNNKKVTFYDDGNTKICTSTFKQVGKAVTTLLSLPIESTGSGACLDDYKNKYVRFNSFTISQKDMFESLKRVTGTSDSDWAVDYEPSKDRFERGLQAMQKGDRTKFGLLLYGRTLYPDDTANMEKRVGLENANLGLPKEDLDEATKFAIRKSEAAKGSSNMFEAMGRIRSVRA